MEMDTIILATIGTLLGSENLTEITGLLTVIVALIGILISFMTIRLTKQQNKENRDQSRQQFEATRQETIINRFNHAIENLKDESLAIRMSALFELKKIGLALPEEQENITRILSAFVIERIENRELLRVPVDPSHAPYPSKDVVVSCEIMSLYYRKSNYRAWLRRLRANDLYLSGFELQGANLYKAYFRGARLLYSNLQDADLQGADLQDANLSEVNFNNTNVQGVNFKGADLRGAKNLRAEQLLTAYIDDTTLLDTDLRAEYERLSK